MEYHIDTGLIWEGFKGDNECPLCAIYDIVNRRVVEQFTTEAVMEDGARAKVNKYGFCTSHFDQLLKLPNKLGIALQSSTRLMAVRKNAAIPKNAKQARKEADRIQHELSTCVLCDLNDFNMKRYYQTVAQLYGQEPEFAELLKNGKGFCQHHYSELLRYAHESAYIQALTAVQMQGLERVQKELDWFCDKFDYRNASKPFGTSVDAVPRAIKKLR